ncbi:MAG: Chemotaxis protein CheR [Bacteroidetes bacterium]|nr:Chemotaxis protein CheR [Bacteroidota bacterium]
MNKAKKAVTSGKSLKKAAQKKVSKIENVIVKNDFPVVGMGGSAGSLQEFEKFFSRMPPNPGMAFVVIMHLDPNHKARVVELLQNFTSLPVQEVKDGTLIEKDNVYVIPPNADIGIHNRTLLLLSASRPKGIAMPIDHFFQSLAEDQWSRSVGVIFSGMGTDGETGIRMIKEKLGMVMVQDPLTAQYDSMPKSSIATGQADYILPSEEMPLKLIQYLKHPALFEEHSLQAISDAKNTNAFHKILMILRSQTGHDFSLYKKNTIMRRIDRRIAFHQLPDYSYYVNFLKENPVEVNVLFNELLIGVTKFFRDAESFTALKKHLFHVLNQKDEGDPIRIWIAGCSTGEEAYSIAILVMEYLGSNNRVKPSAVQIFATDLDSEAIEHARVGFYFENIIADVSPERIDKFFIKKNGGYQVKKELRELIVFAQHNIIKDAPFTRLDLLSCRNLMIYLTTELQNKIMPVFHYSINPNGLLFLGPAETIGEFTDVFKIIDAKWRIAARNESGATLNRIIDFPFNISTNRQPISVELKQTKKSSLQDRFHKVLLENYTPAAILINEKGDILYINGKTGKYLELSSGEAVMNIHHVA